MKVRNVRERQFDASASRVGSLLDSIASPDDMLWPRLSWPAMQFDRPLGIGAIDGHRPIRCTIKDYEPGHRVQFHFTGPPGINGTNGFEVAQLEDKCSRLCHVLEMNTTGIALTSWPLVFRPLHDWLIEDLLDLAEQNIGTTPRPTGINLRRN